MALEQQRPERLAQQVRQEQPGLQGPLAELRQQLAGLPMPTVQLISQVEQEQLAPLVLPGLLVLLERLPLAVPTVESERLLVESMAELEPRQVLLGQQAQMVQEPHER